jgi:hypothetical protein
MHTPDQRKKLSVFEKVILILLFLYFTEVVFGGPGSWSKDYLHIDLRRTFFVFLCVFLLLNVLIKSRTLRMVDVSVCIVGIVSFIFWIGLLPVLHGIDQSYSIVDGTPLFFMFVVTWLFTINAIKWRKQDITLYNKICNFVFIISIISAVMHIVIYVLLTFFPSIGLVLLAGIKIIFDSEDRGSIYIGPMPDSSIRVFWISSLFMVYGFYRSIGKIVDKINIRSMVLLLIFFAAILITQTRSILLALPIAAIFAFVLNFFVRQRFFSKVGLSIIVTVILASVTFFQIAAASPDIISFLGLSRGGSDDSRFLQIGPLLDAWFQNIFIGNGFGAQASIIRSPTSPFSYEMSILALYMKMGILGALLSSLYFIYLMVSLLPPRNSIMKKRKEFIALFIAVFAFCFIFNTNPYLSNSVGVAIVLLFCIETARLSAPEAAAYS